MVRGRLAATRCCRPGIAAGHSVASPGRGKGGGGGGGSHKIMNDFPSPPRSPPTLPPPHHTWTNKKEKKRHESPRHKILRFTQKNALLKANKRIDKPPNATARGPCCEKGRPLVARCIIWSHAWRRAVAARYAQVGRSPQGHLGPFSRPRRTRGGPRLLSPGTKSWSDL